MFRTLHFGLIAACAAFVASSLSACGSDSKGSSSSTGTVALGQTAVAKFACTSCHGADLSGSTSPYTGTTASYPANLTPDAETGIGEWDADTIVTAILTGKDDDGKNLCSTMPKFSTMNMTMDEANSIAAYLKSLAPAKKEIPESMCAEKT
jgi:mono/diheme cytochrome c family protein